MYMNQSCQKRATEVLYPERSHFRPFSTWSPCSKWGPNPPRFVGTNDHEKGGNGRVDGLTDFTEKADETNEKNQPGHHVPKL
jgi:hypothetical protein